MMPGVDRTWATTLLLATAATAQTFVVDANNGPGASFTSISTAAAAVPSGAVLLVLPGTYDPFTIHNKALTVSGQSGVVVTGQPSQMSSVTIASTAPGQRVVVRDIVMRTAAGGPVRLDVQSCQGPVFLQRVNLDAVFYPGVVRSLHVLDSAQVLADGCGPFQDAVGPTGSGAVDVHNSGLALAACSVPITAGIGVRASNSHVQIVDSTISSWTVGIEALGATVRLAGAGSVAANTFGTAISGNGLVLRDPAVTISGPIAPGVTVVTAPQPFVRSSGGAIGTQADAALHGPAGHLGVLCLGLPATPTLTPGFAHPVWLAPGFAAGPAGTLGLPLHASVFVPSNPALLGESYCWQGGTLDPAGLVTITNPSMFAP